MRTPKFACGCRSSVEAYESAMDWAREQLYDETFHIAFQEGHEDSNVTRRRGWEILDKPKWVRETKRVAREWIECSDCDVCDPDIDGEFYG